MDKIEEKSCLTVFPQAYEQVSSVSEVFGRTFFLNVENFSLLNCFIIANSEVRRCVMRSVSTFSVSLPIGLEFKLLRI